MADRSVLTEGASPCQNTLTQHWIVSTAASTWAEFFFHSTQRLWCVLGLRKILKQCSLKNLQTSLSSVLGRGVCTSFRLKHFWQADGKLVTKGRRQKGGNEDENLELCLTGRLILFLRFERQHIPPMWIGKIETTWKSAVELEVMETCSGVHGDFLNITNLKTIPSPF